MYVMHVAIGGCLTAPKVDYGITEDTGGHIAYVLGAATAQSNRDDIDRIDIVTRAFDDPDLGAIYARPLQIVGPKLRILRLETSCQGYLSKEGLAVERPALTDAFDTLIERLDRKPDVIHAHFADAVAIARPASTRFDIPVIYTPHSLGIDKQRHVADAAGAGLQTRIDLETAALRHSDAVIVSSRDEAERQISGYGEDVMGWTHRIPPGVFQVDATAGTEAAVRLLDPYFTEPERPLILAIARPVKRKNLIGLLRAYSTSERLRKTANLAIVAGIRVAKQGADGEDREAERVLDELRTAIVSDRLEGCVALPPHHDSGMVPALYRLARERRGVFVNPAFHEPFGLTLLEAAAAGLPVVATTEGGPADIVGTIEHGVLVDPRDIREIADAIAGLLSNRPSWDRASQNARAGIAEYSWGDWARRSRRVYASARTRPNRSVARPFNLLVCDLNGTLTGNRDAARRFAVWIARRRSRGQAYAIATGSCMTEARTVLSDWGIPEPDAFITDVGTEIHVRGDDGRFRPDLAFRRDIASDWDPEAVMRVIINLGLILQRPIEQKPFKFAAYGTERNADDLRRRLRRSRISAQVILSHGHLIDILPRHGGKRYAVAHLAGIYDLDLEDCIAAGDSGSDAEMLTSVGQGILVGNAMPETARLSGSGLVRARARHADGVLEGLNLLGILSHEWHDVSYRQISPSRPCPCDAVFLRR
jgi:sucrose-phosphate synthase